MQPSLLVLAAGMGSRYGGLKQIDPVGPNGEVIIDYSVYDAIRSGFGKVVFVIRRDIETAFRESIGNRFARHIPVEYAFQELTDLPAGYSVPDGRDKPWGTGQAILAAKEKINEPFAAINADDFYGVTGYRLLQQYLTALPEEDTTSYAMVGYVLRRTLSDHGHVSRGICSCDKDGFVTGVTERTHVVRNGENARFTADDGALTDISGDSLVSMNMWGFTPSVFDHLESEFETFLSGQGSALKSEFLIPTVVGTLVQKGLARVAMLESPDSWFGITYKEDKPTVVEDIKKLVEAGQYPQSLLP